MIPKYNILNPVRINEKEENSAITENPTLSTLKMVNLLNCPVEVYT